MPRPSRPWGGTSRRGAGPAGLRLALHLAPRAPTTRPTSRPRPQPPSGDARAPHPGRRAAPTRRRRCPVAIAGARAQLADVRAVQRPAGAAVHARPIPAKRAFDRAGIRIAAADPDRRPRVLDRTRAEGDLLNAEVLSPEGEGLSAPQSCNDLQPLVEDFGSNTCVRLLREMRVARVALVADAHPQDEAAIRQLVDRSRLACDVPRPAPSQGDDLDAERDPSRADGHRRERRPRVGGRTRRVTLVEDVVLEEDSVPPSLLRQFGELEQEAGVAAFVARRQRQAVAHVRQGTTRSDV